MMPCFASFLLFFGCFHFWCLKASKFTSENAGKIPVLQSPSSAAGKVINSGQNYEKIIQLLQDNQKLLLDTKRQVQEIQEEVLLLKVGMDLIISEFFKSSCGDAVSATGKEQATLGIFTVKLPNMLPKKVRCESVGGEDGWAVILERRNGKELFNRTYTEYRDGFGDATSEFWIGLEFLQKLTSWKPHRLYAQLEDFDGKTAWALYNFFKVGSMESSYELRADAYDSKSTAGNGLLVHNGMAFSTYDFDKDGDPKQNCAVIMGGGGGWWYNQCYQVLATGEYRNKKGNAYGGVSWYPWRDVKQSLKYFKLLVKPVT